MKNDKKMLEQIKKLEKTVETYGNREYLRQYIDKEFIDSEGDAVIEINLYEGFSIFDKLSRNDQAELNEEIYEYIDKKVKIIPSHIPIRIVFYGRDIEKEEQERIKQLIKEHYSIELFNQQKDRRILRKKTNRLISIGLIMYLIGFYLESIEGYKVLTDIVSIVGTFSLWEVANTLILERRDIRVGTMHKAKMLLLNIEFRE